jgi:hypothetical protein
MSTMAVSVPRTVQYVERRLHSLIHSACSTRGNVTGCTTVRGESVAVGVLIVVLRG